MSLINDALKKAQRQRTGPLDAPPMPGGSHGSARGGAGAPAQLLVLTVAGAVVVVVLSVVATVWFLNRAPAPKPTAKPAPLVAVAKPAAGTPEASPVIIAPVIVHAPPPAVEAAKPPETAAASPVTAAPASAPASPVSAAPVTPAPGASSPVAAAPVSTPAPIPSTTPASTAELPMDVRIATFVDNVHVTGIRASGTGSKVLMNDKVYRLGDVVDRLLGLRLVKIEPDSLTFADVNGTLYTKNF